jgi:hypothetical protein
MEKRTSTIVFILAATAFNILVMLAFVGVVFLFLSWLGQERTNALGVGVAVILIGVPVAGSFLVYRATMKWAQKKYNIDQHLGPLFGPRRDPRR